MDSPRTVSVLYCDVRGYYGKGVGDRVLVHGQSVYRQCYCDVRGYSDNGVGGSVYVDSPRTVSVTVQHTT